MPFRQIRSFLMAQTYDLIMKATERRCLGAWRREILASAQGAILEIGAGTGVNLPFLPKGKEALYLCEPDAQMRRQLQRKSSVSGHSNIRVTDWQAEALNMPDNSFDTIISTLVLCSVADLNLALSEIYRLLKPGGALLFMEHIIADQPRTRAWQRRIEPLWSLCAGDCRLTRDTGNAIEQAGFTIETLTEEPMAGAPAFVNRTIRGLARKPV